MKRLTCRDLGGPCDQEVAGNSFAEMGEKCKTHVVEQIRGGDEAHIAAANKMKSAMPEERQAMFAEFKKKYDEAPEV